MEQLQSLLRQYNLSHKEDLMLAPWSKQYCEEEFPKYWEIVYSILHLFDKNSRVLEIGCGLGDVTAILCYLGFKHVTTLEKDELISRAAQRRIVDMFNMNGVVRNENYPSNKQYTADILILVNCVYAGQTKTKREYLDLIQKYYIYASRPNHFLMEVIDSSYTEKNSEFPEHIRLNRQDVEGLFRNCKISSWVTYRYPQNSKSKTLYLIERQ